MTKVKLTQLSLRKLEEYFSYIIDAIKKDDETQTNKNLKFLLDHVILEDSQKYLIGKDFIATPHYATWCEILPSSYKSMIEFEKIVMDLEKLDRNNAPDYLLMRRAWITEWACKLRDSTRDMEV